MADPYHLALVGAEETQQDQEEVPADNLHIPAVAMPTARLQVALPVAFAIFSDAMREAGEVVMLARHILQDNFLLLSECS